MKIVTIYTTAACPYCERAKRLLASLDIPYKEVDLTENDALRKELIETYQWQSVPIILIDDELVGGYDDLARLRANGELLEKIKTYII